MSNVMQNICSRPEAIEALVCTEFWVVCGNENTTAEMELVRLEDQESMLDPNIVDSPIEMDSANADEINSQIGTVYSPKTSILKRGGLSTLVTKTSPHAIKRSKSMLTRAR
jgi:hypothetical protein